MSYNEWSDKLTSNYEETVSWRRHLHENPEPSFEEVNTRKFIKNKLTEFGYDEIITEVGGGGVVAYLRGNGAGPTIAFRADFDALRIQEKTELDFASKNPGVMHACGHDGHTATLLSVAKVIKEYSSEINGTVKYIFQHAEEVLPGGAKSMIEDGVLDDVDYVYGLHLRSPLEYGKVTYCAGFAMAAPDFFDIKIQGKGGHASSPSGTVDSVVVASYLVNQLQSIISRNKDPKESGVLTVSTLHAGEGAHNVIADTAHIKGTVRTFNPEVRNLIEERINSMSNHICEAHGATCEVEYGRGYPALYNHEEQTELTRDLFIEKFGEESVESIPERMGGEDFAYFLQEKPGSFFFINSGNEEKGIIYPHHHPKFDFDERALLLGGKCFLSIIEHYLTSKETIASKEAAVSGQ